MIKRAARQVFRTCVSCLPQIVIERLVSIHPRIAIEAGAAHGDYGFIRFVPTDTTILPVYARHGSWAKGTNNLLIDFFAAGEGTYFDVGANVGLTTIPVAQNPLVTCIAFEPEPENFVNLRENIRRNVEHGNVEIHHVAICEHRGTVALGISEINKGDHRINFNESGKRRIVNVPAAPLDSFDRKFKKPLAVKIDTQGAEPFVIKSGANLLAQAELVILEFSPQSMRELGCDPEVVLEFIGRFPKVAIQKGESNDAPVYQTAAHASSELRKLMVEESYRYVDVVVRR